MILEEETYEKFGYYSYELSPKSHKQILAKCDLCGIVRNVRKEDYRPFCHPCSMKGKHHSEYTKQKMRESGKEAKKDKRGVPLSEAVRAKIGEANRGRKFTEEHKRKLSEALSGSRNPWYGKTFSKEHIQKLCAAQSGEKNPFYGKHHTEETRKKLREARRKQIFPKNNTGPERIFKKIYKNIELYSIIIDTSNNSFHIGRLNPDFIIHSLKIAIFINGDYWHSPLLKYNIADGQRADYQIRECKKHKWKAIIIWESDLKREDAEQFVLNLLKKEGVIK